MSLVVPNVAEVAVLTEFLKSEDLYLRLYSNNVTPGETDTAATYTQVTGGGYAQITLTAALWAITSGDPSFGLYAQQIFGFTGPTTGPGTIYGYYVVNAANLLKWANRFPGANIPFAPISGSSIKITPRLECS